MTETQLKALTILKDTEYTKPMQAAEFARQMWPESNMHRKTSNQGNGACKGKAAWLCGGSYLGKLQNLGLVRRGEGGRGYCLTAKGKEAIKKPQRLHGTSSPWWTRDL